MGTDTITGEGGSCAETGFERDYLLAIIRQQTDTILSAEAARRLTIETAKRTGTSWTAIGRACGTSRQAVTQRYKP